MNLDQQKLSDRELLILLHDRQSAMGTDIREIKDNTKERLAAIELEIKHLGDTKADHADVNKAITDFASLTRQVARLTNYLWFAFGAVAIIQIGLTVYSTFK